MIFVIRGVWAEIEYDSLMRLAFEHRLGFVLREPFTLDRYGIGILDFRLAF